MTYGAVKPYDSTLAVLSIGGVIIAGYGDAERVVLSPIEDDVSEYVGTDGEVTVASNGNPLWRATVNLGQSSTSNDYLSTLRKRPNVALPVSSFSLNDLNGGTLILGACWIFRPPDLSWAKAVATRSWQLGVSASTVTIAGIPTSPFVLAPGA